MCQTEREEYICDRADDAAGTFEDGFRAGWSAFRDWLDANRPDVAVTLCEPGLKLFEQGALVKALKAVGL